MLALSACVPDTFGEVNYEAATSDVVKSFPVGDATMLNVDTAALAGVVGDFGQVRYTVDREKRIYLLDGDIESGVRRDTRFALLPQPAADFEERTAETERKTWGSSRVYDIGMCSLHLPFNAEGLGVGLDKQLEDELVGVFSRRGSAVRVVTRGRSTAELESRDLFETSRPSRDRLRYTLRLAVDDLEGLCDVVLEFDMLLSVSRLPGAISSGPQCGGAAFDLSDGETFDFKFNLERSGVRVLARGCAAAQEIRRLVAAGVENPATGVAVQLTAALDGLLTIDPKDVGVPEADIAACTCERDCNELNPDQAAYLVGRRGRCVNAAATGEVPRGACFIRLDPARLLLRPEGIELVIAEDASDTQFDVVQTLGSEGGSGLVDFGAVNCNPNRPPRALSEDPPREGSRQRL